MPTKKPAPTVAELKKQLRAHEELERKLYTALISDHITRSTDIHGALWDYAEQMSGCVPEDWSDDDADGLFDDD